MANNITPRRAPGAVQPFVTLNPAPVIANRAPTTFDNYEPSTIWIEQVDNEGNPVNTIWILASVQNGSANWIDVGGGGDADFNNIFLPDTNAAGTVGIIYFGGERFITDYDTVGPNESVYVGKLAGPLTGTSTGNVGVGYRALESLTSNGFCTAVGENAGASLTTGQQNTLIGQAAALNMTTGNQNVVVGCQSLNDPAVTTASNNTIVGFGCVSTLKTGIGNVILGSQSGSAYTGAESNNILIDNAGVLGESNNIRIGDQLIHTAATIAGDTLIIGSLSSSQSVFARGDTGSGTAGTTGFSSITDVVQGAGTLSIKSTTGNNGNNTGFMKFYVGTTVVWVPYFANIAP